MPVIRRLGEKVHQRIFDGLYSRSLLYNACWEDPALDREALRLGQDDEVLVITSAGCNALDYALCAPRRVWAVDANPRQTALLELKLAGIRHLEHADFFRMFGEGRHPGFADLYRTRLRTDLSDFARGWWDGRLHWFADRGPRRSFYFHGLSGLVARAVRGWLRIDAGLRHAVDALLTAHDDSEQRHIYDARVAPRLHSGVVRWAVSRQTTMSLLGVPCSQTREVAKAHDHGVAGFVLASLERVFRDLPLRDNYFWTVYLRGAYTADCCPEYLKPASFAALKAGLVDRVRPTTNTITGFLAQHPGRISRFVLLDHMDWMADRHPAALAEEWTHILDRATPEARAIFRSAHTTPDYLDRVRLDGPGHRTISSHLTYHRTLAETLHRRDRVGTYGGFHIADITG